MDKIINNLPSAYKKDGWIQAIMQAAQLQLDELEQNAIQLGNELMLNLTSEKQLQVEEMLCGFDVSETENIQNRKATVSAKWKVKPIITLDTLQAIANSWSDNIIATYPNADFLKLDFSSDVEAYPKMLEAIRETMPAHIPLFASVLYDIKNNPIYFGFVTQIADTINIFTPPVTIDDTQLFTGATVQIADKVNISTKSDIDIAVNYFGFVTQIADTINAFTPPVTIKDTGIYIATTVQIADFINISSNEVI